MKAKSAPVMDWRQDSDVVELRQREYDLQQRVLVLTSEISRLQASLNASVDSERQLRLKVIVKRAAPSDLQALRDKLDSLQEQLDTAEAEQAAAVDDLQHFPELRRQVETAAQEAAVAALHDAHRADAEALVGVYEAVAEISTRMAERYKAAGAQFPLWSYTDRDNKPYAKHIKSHAGLPMLWDFGAVRVQTTPWSALVFTGTFAEMRDRLREYLGLGRDRGVVTPEIEAERARMFEQERPRMQAAARQAAIAQGYNAELEAERRRQQLAHEKATAQALTDARRK